jgi:hypothetical protein
VESSFGTQAGALFKKNVVFQKRNYKSNCCLISAPILFCVLLFMIQTVVNRVLLNSDDFKVGAPGPALGRWIGDRQAQPAWRPTRAASRVLTLPLPPRPRSAAAGARSAAPPPTAWRRASR